MEPSSYSNSPIQNQFNIANNEIKELKSGLDCLQVLNPVIKRLAPTDATILITGESGTGKSVTAKAIHNYSQMKQGPFIEIHCTNLPGELIEAELFGHEKGAFTGAIASKKGKVELAQGGTLFLDEIGDLHAAGQAKLLRLLQDKVICRVGGREDIQVDTRIILATNKDLKTLVENGKFREDLYYRINTFEMYLPPLRERKNAITPIVEFYLEKNREKLGLNSPFVLPEKLKAQLCQYDWPGNIRELKNTIERLCYLSNGGILDQRDLPSQLKAPVTRNINREEIPAGRQGAGASQETLSLSELEKNHVEMVLAQEKCLKKAAEKLGITVVTLWRKRKIYGIT